MTYSNNKVYLVTGSNIGIGLDATRQLALKESTKIVYLACRTESKARKAMDDLVKDHGIPRSKLVFLPFDASADKSTISKSILEALPSNEQLDGIILNAGGAGFDKEGLPTGPNNVLDMVQINLLGHIHLLDTLKDNSFLKRGETVIVYSGSEAARGVAVMGMAPPKHLNTSSDDYNSLIKGSAYNKYDSMNVYSHVKGMAALYWSAWARKNTDYFVLTVSPGMTGGTNMTSQTSIPKSMRVMMPIMIKVFGVFGAAHNVSVGARRYVDAVNREGEFKGFESGTFVASVRGVSGRVGDQSKHSKGALYGNIFKQDAMYQAMQVYA